MNARIVIGGFIVAHLVSVIFYFPERISENPMVLLNPFAGLSSFGGFLGAFLAFLYFTKKRRESRACTTPIRSRSGCRWAGSSAAPAASPRTTTPGRRTHRSSWRCATPRARATISASTSCCSRSCSTAVLFRYNRKPRPPGRIIGIAALAYAPVRFALDFLRATDVSRPDERYVGLTPAQWAASRPPRSASTCCAADRRPSQPPSTPSRPRRGKSDPRSGGAPRPGRTRPGTPSSS